jgi:2-amino-4-hydroxy-6-hydroxymethyldihydropteridine diphosphokinase
VASEPQGPWVAAYLGIGSNLNDPLAQVNRAFAELAGLRKTRLTACSALYRTAPVGPQDQPDFINAAARIETRLGARELLDALQAIERRHGRLRDGTRWGPRVLDLDILLYGDAVIDRPGLRIPHPELARRAFVLVPLADIAQGDLAIAGQGTLAPLVAARGEAGIRRLGPAAGCGRTAALAESQVPAVVGSEPSAPRVYSRDDEPCP